MKPATINAASMPSSFREFNKVSLCSFKAVDGSQKKQQHKAKKKKRINFLNEKNALYISPPPFFLVLFGFDLFVCASVRVCALKKRMNFKWG